ncbi:MAG: hypothetical protein JXK94_01270 [Deltaproteobacteria bacterium]|nr:hypothetical protein [Deltaproteobacteria bacterium]
MAISGTETVSTTFSGKVAGETQRYSNKAEKENTFKVVFEEIMENGLLKYAEKKRREKMREEILGKMGLSEEALKELPPEKRMKIEARISEEIMKRLAAEHELNKKGDNAGENQRQSLLFTSAFLDR